MIYPWFLTFFLSTSCLGLSPKYVLQGTSHRFSLEIVKQPNSILWKHNRKKVMGFNSREFKEYSPYKGRVTLDLKTAELEITNLRLEDSGVYQLELGIDKELHISNYKLVVIAKVELLDISCEMKEGSSSEEPNITATLLCSAKPQRPESLMKIKWLSEGILYHGPKLPITLGDGHDEVEYICSVSNPLSSETASFTAKECYNDESSSAQKQSPKVRLGIFIPLLFLVIVVGTLFGKLRLQETKGKRNRTTEEKPLLDRTETIPSHQHLVQGKDSATDQDQMPPEGMVKDLIDFFNRGINNDEQSLPQRRVTVTKSEEPLSSSSTESPPVQDQGHHANINKDKSSPDELKQTAETKTSRQNTSDMEETQSTAEPAASGLDKEMAHEEGVNGLSPGGASTLPSGAKLPPQMDPNQDPKSGIKDSNPDVNQSITAEEKVLCSDQIDSGQKNDQDPADNSEPDVDAVPISPGYVKKEVDRIDNECAKDEQTHLKKDRGGTKSEYIPPLSPLTPGAGSAITGNLNSDLKDYDPDTNKPKDPAEEKAPSDHTNSVENHEPGPADENPAPKQEGGVKADEPEGTLIESGSDQVNGGEPEESVQGSNSSENQQNEGNSDPSDTEELPHDSVPKTSAVTSSDICIDKTLNTPQDGQAKGEQAGQDSTE